ncbi:Ubiquitin-fold modifier-conjugating enzyme 1 [Porphyridium purpureum]|nr:Ubiquitin-fold modifier-conjugating enzyme 1 [Porphyridium purpureum]|eukprot:POR7277..scf251_18
MCSEAPRQRRPGKQVLAISNTRNEYEFSRCEYASSMRRRLALCREPSWTAWSRKAARMDEGTKRTVQKIPLLNVNAGPRDGDEWTARLKEELNALIGYIQVNKAQDNDWFQIECNKTGSRWTGKCWYYYEQVRYEFDLEFELPVTYPATAPELMLPQLDGLTAKMYRGGKICQTIHFQPLWARNVPRFGIAHALALGLGPWLAAEIPDLVARGVITKFAK